MDIKKIKSKIVNWYENYPSEGIEISETNYKFMQLGKNKEIKMKQMWALEELKDNKATNRGLILNFSTAYIHYHFLDVEDKFESKEAEKKMLFWKLKNKVPYLKEDDIFYDYYKINEKKYLLFNLDREVFEGLKFYLPKGNEYIINVELMGIYNYYVSLYNSNQIKKSKNVVLINMGETITDLIFIENEKLKYIRSFEIGTKDYMKNINKSFENILDGFSYFLANTYIPQNIEELFDPAKLENFNMIKDVNKNWMKEIDESIRFYIPDDKRSGFELFFMRYENYINNLDFVLSNYLNLPVHKIKANNKDIPFIAIYGNIMKHQL